MKIEIWFQSCRRESIDLFMKRSRSLLSTQGSWQYPRTIRNITLGKAMNIAWVLRAREENLGAFLKAMTDPRNRLDRCNPDTDTVNDTIVYLDSLQNVTSWYVCSRDYDSNPFYNSVVCRSLHDEDFSPIGTENLSLLVRSDGASYKPEMGMVTYLNGIRNWTVSEEDLDIVGEKDKGDGKPRPGNWWETWTEYQCRVDKEGLEAMRNRA